MYSYYRGISRTAGTVGTTVYTSDNTGGQGEIEILLFNIDFILSI